MHCYKPDLQDKKLVFFSGSLKSFLYAGVQWGKDKGYNGKNIRLKVSYKWFLKRGALLYLMNVNGSTPTSIEPGVV